MVLKFEFCQYVKIAMVIEKNVNLISVKLISIKIVFRTP
jgi:hypothetical protein